MAKKNKQKPSTQKVPFKGAQCYPYHPCMVYLPKFIYIYHKNPPNVRKYTSPMDGMGYVPSKANPPGKDRWLATQLPLVLVSIMARYTNRQRTWEWRRAAIDPFTSRCTLPETNSSHLKIGRNPKGKDHLPTIHFQVQTCCSFQGRYFVLLGAVGRSPSWVCRQGG